MPLSTLKEKGQITIPVAIRDQIHAQKGDIFNFEVINNQVVLTPQDIEPSLKAIPKNGRDVGQYIGVLKGSFGSVEEIDAFIQNERESWG